MAEGVRIGVDVGGTFKGVVAWDPAGRMESCKVPTTPANPAEGGLNGLAARAPHTAPRRAPPPSPPPRGFRGLPAMGPMGRPPPYRLGLPARADPLVPRRLRREVTER